MPSVEEDAEAKRRRVATVAVRPWSGVRECHFRWNCQAQTTHWKNNPQICEHCICYVCNVALRVCGHHSHRWAAPAEVTRWEVDRNRPLQCVSLGATSAPQGVQGRTKLFTLNLPMRIDADARAFIINQVGVPPAVFLNYMHQWAPITVWPLVKDMFFMAASNSDMYRRMGVLTSIALTQPVLQKEARRMIGRMEWPPGIPDSLFAATMRIVRTDSAGERVLPDYIPRVHTLEVDVYAGRLSHYRHYSAAAFDCVPVRAVEPSEPSEEVQRALAGLDALARPLFPHQEASLRQMLVIERDGLTARLWRRFDGHEELYINPAFHSFHRGGRPDAQCTGGLVCNDRGTGKTYLSATLVATGRAPEAWLAAEDAPGEVDPPSAAPEPAPGPPVLVSDSSDDEDAHAIARVSSWSHNVLLQPGERALQAWHAEPAPRVGTTLIVVPGSNLLQQWHDEVASLGLNVATFHGKSRIAHPGDLEGVDVLLTTSSTLRSSLTHPEQTLRDGCNDQSIFARVRFWRIVVDEVHKLLQNNSVNKAGQALLWVRARARWGLTATPAATLGRCRLYAQMLYGVPTKVSAESSLLHHFVRYPAQYSQTVAMRRMYQDEILPAMIVQEQPVSAIMPTVRFREVRVEPDADWLGQYHDLFRASQHVARSTTGPRVNLMLNRLLMCLGGVRSFGRPTIEEYGGAASADGGSRPEVPIDVVDCPICLCNLSRPVQTQCEHYFCEGCIRHWRTQSGSCPLCRTTLNQPTKRCIFAEEELAEGDAGSELPPCPSKLERIITDIATLATQDNSGNPSEAERRPNRILVFSRFPQVRASIMAAVGAVVGCTDSVQDFQNDDNLSVLCLSMQSCSVGLNLMQANHVMLAEPSFKRANDEQAYARAARIGQTREVHVHRYLTKGTVEERVFAGAVAGAVGLRSVFEVDSDSEEE
jgi:hypothetical protein